jgi:hypothetical protein
MNFWVATVVTGLLSLYYLKTILDFSLDLVFYIRNGFNFKQDSGRNISFGGAGRIPGRPKRISNRSRVLFAYPFELVIFGFLLRSIGLEYLKFFE